MSPRSDDPLGCVVTGKTTPKSDCDTSKPYINLVATILSKDLVTTLQRSDQDGLMLVWGDSPDQVRNDGRRAFYRFINLERATGATVF